MGISDLVLPRHCVGCGCASAHLCPDCLVLFRDQVDPRIVTASPIPVCSAAAYDGICRQIVLAAKRTGQVAMVECLADLLTLSMRYLLEDLSTRGVATRHELVALVPIHSGSVTRRSAGLDLVEAMVKRAMRRLRSPPAEIEVIDALISRPAGVNQKELNRVQRRRNVRGRFIARCDDRLEAVPVILVDDVMTTGSTIAAARAALCARGAHVVGAAVAARRL